MHITRARFLRCVRLSPLLSLNDDESQLRLREDAMFVYGGNVADKGSGIATRHCTCAHYTYQRAHWH